MVVIKCIIFLCITAYIVFAAGMNFNSLKQYFLSAIITKQFIFLMNLSYYFYFEIHIKFH